MKASAIAMIALLAGGLIAPSHEVLARGAGGQRVGERVGPGHRARRAIPLMRALLMSHAQGNVDHKLKEIIRILLARFAKDKYFASLRSTKARDMGLTEKRIDEGCFAYEDDSKGFSEAEKCALRYADLMFLDANQLDKTFYDEMKKHWSEAQIMELGAFIAFHYGMQMFMRSLGAVSLARHTRTEDPI
jgi:alkylhydroperoxidase family enzyme